MWHSDFAPSAPASFSVSSLSHSIPGIRGSIPRLHGAHVTSSSCSSERSTAADREELSLKGANSPIIDTFRWIMLHIWVNWLTHLGKEAPKRVFRETLTVPTVFGAALGAHIDRPASGPNFGIMCVWRELGLELAIGTGPVSLQNNQSCNLGDRILSANLSSRK